MFNGEVLDVTQPAPGVYRAQITTQPLGCLSSTAKRSMQAELQAIEARVDCRAVILTGAGRSFSVGSDIREFSVDPNWIESAIKAEHELLANIETSSTPYLAACNGLTLGGGADLALACDFIIAAESARFGFPEVVVGAFGATQRLPQSIGRQSALRLLLSGDIITSSEAARIGLVQHVVPDHDFTPYVTALAGRIASYPPGAIAATKRCVSELCENGRTSGMQMEADLNLVIGTSYDAVEGQRAFIEKRSPEYRFERLQLDGSPAPALQSRSV